MLTRNLLTTTLRFPLRPYLADANSAMACDNRQAPRAAERQERIMPDLPSGTVTFLFTDIEGSTALWERDRVAMATAVERHLVLLRGAIEEHRGALYKSVGDGTQSAFSAARD